ncbi:MAG: BamA/TamA family outer membrane protein [Taibaiella sp.]|nr:BamA/TamA family outer membrane protein [Taibaiella sp.]
MRNHIIILILLVLLLLTSCSNSRHLVEGQSLFVGSKVIIKDNDKSKKERKLLTNDIAGLVRPKPNTKVLGVRLKLTLYNFFGKHTKKKGLKAKLRKKLGEEPVLANVVSIETNKNLVENYLENRGYFHAKASGKMVTNKKRKSTIELEVTTGRQYKINTVMFRRDSSEIAASIDTDFHNTLLKPGGPYNLDVIKAERSRIDRYLKERGFYFFKADYILVVVDSSIGDDKVNMYVRLKRREIPPEVYASYDINNIYIYANYRLTGDKQDTSKADIVQVDNYYVIDKNKKFKPSVFSQAMIFEKGDEYSLEDQNKSLSRLINMGTFKFVKNRFDVIGDSLLDVYYYLTPFPKKSIRFELGGLTQNDNRAGTKGSISWKNRNAFKGAEQLTFKLNGGFEAQYGGAVKRPNIYNFGAETNLSIPRFVVPLISIQTLSRYLPRTIFKLKYTYESETQLLRINSYNASYGYDWKEGPRKSHQLFPFNFTYVRTDTLGGTDKLNLLYGNLVFNGIILGPTYHFTYNSQITGSQKKSYFFDGLIDLSGNIMGLAQGADYEKKPATLFGSSYAQYIKLQPDLRGYYPLNNATTVAARVIAGVGIPYGNSRQLPNVKQFWAGGNSDLRGFPSRLVGPGTFNIYDTKDNAAQYIETLGDIKLEGSVELRQHLYKFLNAALFLDAGNIWLYRENSAFPGGAFSKDFYKQLAADAGIGLRFDFNILILRLDLGMPVRKPWLPEGERWVINKVSFADPAWKKQNLIFNIAIGYPF